MIGFGWQVAASMLTSGLSASVEMTGVLAAEVRLPIFIGINSVGKSVVVFEWFSLAGWR